MSAVTSRGVIPRQRVSRRHGQLTSRDTPVLVRDVMDTQVTPVRPDTPLTAVRAAVLATWHRVVPVVDNGRLVGVVSATDLLRERVRSATVAETAADLMNPPTALTPHTTCVDAARLMLTTTETALPVVHEGGTFAAMVSVEDLLQAL
ncbi:CBS domain-containing protein [Actinokineospora terrae]|uniref:CBS domain-containing protein n=1 Tax=Actinokineospora terrae TaxID=155974 RepID=A0A1H9XHA5_9PSEU|nr:CBS domain-containing protein [Actinokineospora terrae]SES45570.1 CBS domain-containing protein [Actinokineospora terrae]